MFQEANIATGRNLFDCLNTSLLRNGISLSKLIGFGSDNANVMIGRRNSVWSRVQEQQPQAVLVGCVCHLAHLCASDACEELPDEVEKMVTDIFVHFYRSSARYNELSYLINPLFDSPNISSVL